MILLANFLLGLANVLGSLLQIYLLVLFVYVALSWFKVSQYHPIVRAINAAVEPVLYWLRRKFGLVYNGIDLSPIVIFCLIFFLQNVVVRSLSDYATVIRAQTLQSAVTANLPSANIPGATDY